MSLDFEQIEGMAEYADSHSPFYVEDVKESQPYDLPAPFSIYLTTNMLNESYESMLHHDDFDIEPCIDIDDSWKEKLANMWSPSDVSSWIKSLVNKYPLGFIQEQPYWGIDGTSLICKNQKAFKSLDPISGDYVFEELQKLCAEQLKRMSGCVEETCEQKYQEQMDSITAILNIYSFDGTEFKSFDKYLDGKLEKESSSDDESDISEPPSPTPSPVPKAKKPERKRKGKLWEFIRDLLLDDGKNPSIIKWEDRSQGVFKIVRSDKVAELWGSRKANTSMTYEKMSRAMRYYYRKGILEKIDDGRRLVYKFGSKSKGWQI